MMPLRGSLRKMTRQSSFGQGGLSMVDRFGVYLSKRAVMRHLPRGDSLAAPDLGCGYEAALLSSLSSRIQSGVGIDVKISEAIRQSPKLTFVESSIEDALPNLKTGAFDVIFLLSVLEHLNDPLSVLTECRRLMRPKAVLMINVPTWLGKQLLEFSAFQLGLRGALEIEDHKRYYDVRDLWPCLVKAGFKPGQIRLRYHKFGLNLFGVCRK